MGFLGFNVKTLSFKCML